MKWQRYIYRWSSYTFWRRRVKYHNTPYIKNLPSTLLPHSCSNTFCEDGWREAAPRRLPPPQERGETSWLQKRKEASQESGARWWAWSCCRWCFCHGIMFCQLSLANLNYVCYYIYIFWLIFFLRYSFISCTNQSF